MNWPLVGEYVKNVWAIAGPLVGVLIGAYIANLNQRQQWISDCKKEEYSRLLGLMTKSVSLFILAKSNTLPEKGFERERALAESWSSVAEDIHSKIFIVDKLEAHSVFDRWMQGFQMYRQGNEIEATSKAWGKLLDDIRKAAIDDLGG
jgi:hypothetical protein